MIDMSHNLECTYHQLAEDVANEIIKNCKTEKIDQQAYAIAYAGAFIAKALENLRAAIELEFDVRRDNG